MVPYPGVFSQLATWWQVDYIGPVPSWKGQHFVLTGIDTYPGYRFFFLALKAAELPKLPSVDLLNTLSISMVLHIVLLLIKELMSQPKKCSNEPMLVEFTGFTKIPPLEATGSIGQWNGLWKIQLRHQLGGNSL